MPVINSPREHLKLTCKHRQVYRVSGLFWLSACVSPTLRLYAYMCVFNCFRLSPVDIVIFCRRNLTDAFGDGFHLYGVTWTDTYISFTVDGEEIGRVTPPQGGFWEYGNFTGDNLWENGEHMAPFDQEVRLYCKSNC